MISGLLKKELNELDILWIPSNSKRFEKMFENLGYNFFGLEDLFLGLCYPNLIISNNRFINMDKIINLVLTHQCNLIIIDHEEKPDIVKQNKVLEKLSMIPNILQIAMNQKIYDSWDKIHDAVCETHINPQDFKKIIDNFAKKIFIQK